MMEKKEKQVKMKNVYVKSLTDPSCQYKSRNMCFLGNNQNEESRIDIFVGQQTILACHLDKTAEDGWARIFRHICRFNVWRL